jgi:hypothetical protein
MPPRGDQAAIGLRESQECSYGGGLSSLFSPAIAALTVFRQNLRDEVAMDVDEEDEEGDSTLHQRRVTDYGIEVDFELLSANEREVSAFVLVYDMMCPFLCDRRGVDAEIRWRSIGRT